MQNRRRTQALAVSRPDWMPQPLVLSVLLALWTAATALHFLPHVWQH